MLTITPELLTALAAGSELHPGESMTGRLEARIPDSQDAALDALAMALTGDKSKRSVAARYVLARGFRALGEDAERA